MIARVQRGVPSPPSPGELEPDEGSLFWLVRDMTHDWHGRVPLAWTLLGDEWLRAAWERCDVATPMLALALGAPRLWVRDTWAEGDGAAVVVEAQYDYLASAGGGSWSCAFPAERAAVRVGEYGYVASLLRAAFPPPSWVDIARLAPAFAGEGLPC